MSTKTTIALIALNILTLLIAVAALVLTLTGKKQEAPAAEPAPAGTPQYVMYIGTNDKDTYTQLIPEDEAKRIVNEICLSHFDGYTLQEAHGMWTDETGTPTQEYTIVCYFDDAEQAEVYAAADEIIRALNQNTVLIERDEISIDYYSGKN